MNTALYGPMTSGETKVEALLSSKQSPILNLAMHARSSDLISAICRLVAVPCAAVSAKLSATCEAVVPAEDTGMEYGEHTASQAFSLLVFAALAMAASGFFGQKNAEEQKRGLPEAPQNFSLYCGDVAGGILVAYATALSGDDNDAWK